MEKRVLGWTGHESSLVTLGSYVFTRIPQDEADKAMELALEHGVNHIDVSPNYGEAMERLAPWMPRIREQVFLGAKTSKRSKDEAWEDIRSSMRRLGVDSFDLFQLHEVTKIERLDEVTRPGGALEALVEMREQGLTKWIGITGHHTAAPKTHLEALNRFDFDTVMFEVGAVHYRNPEYRRDAEELLEVARTKNVGVQTIKMLMRGGRGDGESDMNVGYDPHREQDDIDRALWWLFSQPIHTAPTTGEAKLWPQIRSAA
ncbi:MAG: aldo/keto reductase [Chloroflexi bacterium]|nr:aldo/keto reductase [Chloroflexota bacterium]